MEPKLGFKKWRGVLMTTLLLSSIFCYGTAMADIVNIDNSYVSFTLDTSQGDLSHLTWKGGSNQDLWDPNWNNVHSAGDFRLGSQYGSGGFHENNDTLVGYSADANHITASFASPDYGTKSLNINWGTNGLFVSVALDLTRSDLMMGGLWQPGGDHYNDYLKIYPLTGSPYTEEFNYPGPFTPVFGGDVISIGVADHRYDEMFGYKSGGFQYIAAGASMDGPLLLGLSAGQSTVEFALTSLQGYENFANPVPEPATILLFGAGMAALAGAGLRRRKQ
jgi:hypothetical protein